MSRQTLFLIDGSSQMYRAYHAFRGKGLSNQTGQTTHAVYVFVTMLRKLQELGFDEGEPIESIGFTRWAPTAGTDGDGVAGAGQGDDPPPELQGGQHRGFRLHAFGPHPLRGKGAMKRNPSGCSHRHHVAINMPEAA